MNPEDQMWDFAQKRLGYTNEDMELFKQNPRNREVLLKVPELMSKRIVGEVVESHGCLSQHKKGDKFHMDGAGNLIAKLCPEMMCAGAIHTLAPAVFTAVQLSLTGVDPNKMPFNRVGCPDVGLQCGGFGKIVMEVRVEDAKG